LAGPVDFANFLATVFAMLHGYAFLLKTFLDKTGNLLFVFDNQDTHRSLFFFNKLYQIPYSPLVVFSAKKLD